MLSFEHQKRITACLVQVYVANNKLATEAIVYLRKKVIGIKITKG